MFLQRTLSERWNARPALRFGPLSPRARLVLVYGLMALAMLAFLTINQRASWEFTLRFRGTKVLALLLVAYAIALSTLLFQTLTHNRILAPGIMGFDSLYILIQTLLVFSFGSQFLTALPPEVKWLGEVLILTVATCSLYFWLFHHQRRELQTLVLVGIVFGILFRSLSGFIGRMIDPVEFDFLQDNLFASFNTVDTQLLGLSAVVCGALSVYLWRLRHQFDVLALGEQHAISLGLNYRKLVMIVLIAVSVLVAVATALVGPVTFFGLMVVNLAYHLAGTHEHRYLMPMSAALAMLCLVGGQAVLEHWLRFGTGLAVIIEFVGGIFFILLMLKQGRQ